MFRITTHHKGRVRVVAFAGHLEDSDLEEVRQVLSSSAGQVELDLSDLEACSGPVAQELRGWLDKGVRLGSASPFLRMLLTMKPDAAQPPV